MKYDEYMASFNATNVKNSIVVWIRQWFKENGNDCDAIVGISGGKDSSVVAALCVEALGKDRVIGVMMPDGIQRDIADSERLISHLGISNLEVNVESAVDAVLESVRLGFNTSNMTPEYFLDEFPSQTLVNLPPRIRMATLYAAAQTWNGRVANTCNLSEEWVGYSTRYGDSVGDFSPLSMLTTDEIIAIGIACGLPRDLVEKVPSDGLCGKTDEDNFGFTYNALNKYIRTGECEDPVTRSKINIMHEKNLFKAIPMPKFEFKSDKD